MTGHHTVQRFHLAHFTGDSPKGQVWVYDCRSKEPRSAIPENVSTENNFYSFEREDGTWDTRLEEWMSVVESKAVPVYLELLAGKIPPYSQAKYDFAQYLALAHVRTRTMRRMSAEQAGKLMQVRHYAHGQDKALFEQSMQSYEETIGKTFEPEVRERIRQMLLDPSDFILSLPKSYGFRPFLELDDLTHIFLHTHWTLAEAASGFLITSDNPVARRVAPESVHPLLGDRGFRNKTMEVSFPLSPRMLLVLTHFEPPKTHLVIDSEFVSAQNAIRAWHCEFELYSHLKHKHISKLSRQYANQRPGYKLSGYGPKNFSPIQVQRRRPKTSARP